MNIPKKDCFGYVNIEGCERCYALKFMRCDGCVFYKPCEDSDDARFLIEQDIEQYNSTRRI